MFYSQFILAKKGPLGTIWIAAHLERKLRKNQVADTDIGVSVDSILFPEAPIALRLSSHLLLGVVRIYSRKVNYLFDDCSEALLKVKQAFRSAAVDLPPEESTAPYHSITLPETFDLDDFELPDNEIFQGGNYVDHHVSTREQITLQDTMDGVVYSTSQFGLDEQFGDGDTSQAALDLDEQVFHDKDVVGSENEEGPSADHNAYVDAATPNNAHLDAATPNNAYLNAATPEMKDEMIGASDAMPRDLNEEQVEDLAMHVEDAQAPQTPGLVEVPNSSSVREQMACDDHTEVEDLNADEGRKTSGELDTNEMHKPEEDPPSGYNAGESAVTPMEVDKSQIDENVNAQNEPVEERAEHVHMTSPCYSHITTEMEDPGQVIPEAAIDVNNNVVADISDAVPPAESPVGPTMSNAEHCLSQQPKSLGEENRDHFATATEVNQETNYSLQGDGQAYSKPDEQLSNAHTTEEQLGILTGFANSDLPAPEQLNNVHATEQQLGMFSGFANSGLPAPKQLNNVHATEQHLGKFTGFATSGLSAPEQLNNPRATEQHLGKFTGFANSGLPAHEQLNNLRATEQHLGKFTGFANSGLPAHEQLNNPRATEQHLEKFTGFANSGLPAPGQLNHPHATEQQLGNLTRFPNSDFPAPKQLNNAHATEQHLGKLTGFANSGLPPPEQLNNAHATGKQSGNLTGFANSGLSASEQLNNQHATGKQSGNLTGFANSGLPAPKRLNNAHATEQQLGFLTGFPNSGLPGPKQLNNAHATEQHLGMFSGFASSGLPAPKQLNNAHTTEQHLGKFTGFVTSGLPASEQLNHPHATEQHLGKLTGFANSGLPAPKQLNNAHATGQQLGNLTRFADFPAPEQLNNAHTTEELLGNLRFSDSYSPAPEQLNIAHTSATAQLGNLTRFADSDLPAPEKILAAPNGLGIGNNFMVESTPARDFPGTFNEDARNNNITGKKRTFTESTLTAESLNSVESVRLFQSKRTADSVPRDDDLLSSILGGKTPFLKMKPTPVLEATTTKRIRSAPRSTATKRKVLMDDPMVLHGDIIRQQLTNTEGIRRVRKKAPCTIPEILMLQRKALGDGLLKEPIFTGMSVEIVSLHNEPYDLRGIMIIESDKHHASVGVVDNNECSVRAVEENKTEESYVPQAPLNDFLEQSSEAHAYPQDQQIIHQQEETKDDGEPGEIISDLEVLKEGNGAATEVNLVASDEISQMPSEDKHDHGEDLQVERSHEYHDGGLWGQDGICADLNEKSCTEVIEIAEGDIDINAVFNETDLKVEDELTREDNKTDASAEVGEIGVDDQTPCDNAVGSIETGSVEAVVLTNLALENCNEPLVEANSDAVNPQIVEANNDGVNPEIVEANNDGVNPEIVEANSDGVNPEIVEANSDGVNPEIVEANSDGVNPEIVEANNDDVNPEIVEANNDDVNPEIESYNKDEPHTEMPNEEAYMQSALFGEEPTSHDDFMGDDDDDDEMDSMEVEHDTGFLNVDDDEVEEDHEDDDAECGDETRLLENSGWSSRTRAVAKYLQTLFDKEAEHGKNVLVADKLLTGKTRKEASRLFFETLVLKTRDYVQVEQAKPYENIIIKPRPKLTKSIF